MTDNNMQASIGAAGPMADPKGLRLLVLDCDGVLTPGHIIYDNQRIESKFFSARDGLGLRLLREVGLQVAVVTGRASEVVAQRCVDLRIEHVLQGVSDKFAAVESLHRKLDLSWEHTAVMGDDWNDWPMLRRAGLSATPADGAVELRRRVHFVSPGKGGQSAVRDLVNHILKLRNERLYAAQSFLDDITGR